MDSQTSQSLNEAYKQLKDSTTINRLWAVRRIGEIGINHTRLIEQLQGMVQNDPDQNVRATAGQSLAILQSRPSEPPVPAAQALYAPNTPPTQPSGETDAEILATMRRQAAILDNILTFLTRSAEAQKSDRYNLRASIVEFDMSMGAMMNFMLKWLIASIPVAIILGFVGFIVTACTAGLGR